ncbi:DNA glycosylase [Schizothecium vesticola]|uniref:DNA-(apurinic or apyrimidinic site) lyase n=1 Tax=Schizothecium vesticola TaxID=314040 RepID=A0AA40KA34_9PEZI|nr:DNA glycosylase [Schizothecium vesticola]
MAQGRKLPVSLAELRIDTVLRCGQSFRWRQLDDEWFTHRHCVLKGRLVSLKQDTSHLYYNVTWPSKPPTTSSKSQSTVKTEPCRDEDDVRLLQSYFALSHSLSAMYELWTASDTNFAKRAPAFAGIRILNQDAWETLVSFICSSNNNISRISQMVHKLCLHYGPYISTVQGELFHDFPTPEALTGPKVESHLRELGFGYRAKYIAETARIITEERPLGWLDSLRNPECPALGAIKQEESDEKTATSPTYAAAQEALLGLSGVGPKVADCVCLMGLGWAEAVPVDTHVWQIAQRDYNFGKGAKTKTMNKATYDAVGLHFRKIWGPQAGWAQSVLFTANLKSFAAQASAAKLAVKEEVAKVEEGLVKVEEGLVKVEDEVIKVEDEDKAIRAVSVARAAKRKVKLEDSAVPKLEGGGETTLVRRSKRKKASG